MTRPRLGVALAYAGDFSDAVNEVGRLDELGVELISVSETYSFDAVSQLGYLAAVTKSVALASSILPIYSRTPALLAMTAAGIDALSGGRFELGLGSSGAQVVEGWHGVPFDAPLGRTREIVEICRSVWRREPLDHAGRYYEAPLRSGGTGLGKPLHLINHPVREAIPINIAALTPKSVEQAAEIADGWTPIFYYPEKAADAWGEALAKGAVARDPALPRLDVVAPVPLYIGPGAGLVIAEYKKQIALYLGGMGARGANFYNDLAVRFGFGEAAEKIQELYLSGRKTEATAAVPDELAWKTGLVGSEAEVAERVAAFEASGVTTFSTQPVGLDSATRLTSVETLRSILG